jgi:hypothetical protein
MRWLALLALVTGTTAADDAASAVADHVLVLQNKETVTLEAALDVMAIHGVGKDTATPLLNQVSERGEGIVAQGSRQSCERIASSFDKIGMRATVGAHEGGGGVAVCRERVGG